MKKSLRGFTLVELLVVIGIVTILISLLLPALNKARFTAGQIYCLSNVRQLSTAVMMYANENKGSLPRYSLTGANHWTSLIFPYVGKSPKVFECPLIQDFLAISSLGNPQGGSLTVDGVTYTARLSYKVNGIGIWPTHHQSVSYPFGPVFNIASGGSFVDGGAATMKMGTISSDTIMIFDGFTQSANGFGDRSAEHFGGPSGGGDPGNFDVRSIGVMSHSGKSASIAFADNHCETVLVGTMFSDANYRNTGLVPNSTSNLGRIGDVQIKWNNTDEPKGYWTGDAGD